MIWIVLINYNQGLFTVKCMKSILDALPTGKRVLVIDNASSEGEFEIVYREFKAVENISIIRNEINIGYARAVNQAMRMAFSSGASYVITMNNDTIVDPNAFMALMAGERLYDDKAIVSAKVLYFDHPNRIQYTGSFITNRRTLSEEYPYRDEIDEGQCDNIEERDMIDDILWIVPRIVYEKIGVYDEAFFLYGEQADYALRASKEGFKLVFAPNAKVWHKGSLSTGNGLPNSPRVMFWRVQGSFIYRAKHTSIDALVIYVMKVMMKCIIGLIFTFITKRRLDLRSYGMIRGLLSGIAIVVFRKQNDGENPIHGS